MFHPRVVMGKGRELFRTFVDRHTLLNADDIHRWHWRFARYGVAVVVTMLAWAASLGLRFEMGATVILRSVSDEVSSVLGQNTH